MFILKIHSYLIRIELSKFITKNFKPFLFNNSRRVF